MLTAIFRILSMIWGFINSIYDGVSGFISMVQSLTGTLSGFFDLLPGFLVTFAVAALALALANRIADLL